MHIDVRRRAFQEHTEHFEHQLPGAGEDEDGDENSQHGVGETPAERQQQDSGYHHAYGAEQVGDDVPECPLHVEAAPRGRPQDPCSRQIDEQAGTTGDKDDQPIYLGSVEKPMISLEHNPRGNHNQAYRIEQSGQDLSAVIAESAFDRGGAVGEPHSEQGEADRGGVGEHMARVGDERQAAGENSGSYFDQHIASNQGQSGPQPAPAGATMFMVVDGVVAVVGFAMRRCHASVRDVANRCPTWWFSVHSPAECSTWNVMW